MTSEVLRIGLVNEVVDLYRSQAVGVTLRVETDSRLEPLLADRGRLRQVLNNLLANARTKLALKGA